VAPLSVQQAAVRPRPAVQQAVAAPLPPLPVELLVVHRAIARLRLPPVQALEAPEVRT
jgi:hypothetical protein